MTNTIRYESLQDVYKDVHGIVEANSYEALMLWRDEVSTVSQGNQVRAELPLVGNTKCLFE